MLPRGRQLFLVSLIFPAIFALNCPQNYTDGGDGSCYYWNPALLPSQPRNWLYDDCSRQGGYLLDVGNAFVNSGIQSKAQAQRYGFKYLMLGLTCLTNDPGSCSWDSGLQTSYSNFATGLNTSIGICVLMEIATGLWYSADCSSSPAQYACKWTPEIQRPVCKDEPQLYSTVLGNSCYYAPHKGTDCQPGLPTSIHSDGENTFILNFAKANRLQGPMLIGLNFNGSQFNWSDGSPIDYQNYWTGNSGNGDCVAMTLGNEQNGRRIPAGTWITVDCAAGPASYSSVFCKSAAILSQ